MLAFVQPGPDPRRVPRRSCWSPAVVIAVVARDWDRHSTFEERELARARKRAEKWERGKDARDRDRARWEAHQARQAARPSTAKSFDTRPTGVSYASSPCGTPCARAPTELTSRGAARRRPPSAPLARPGAAHPSPRRRSSRPRAPASPRPEVSPCHVPFPTAPPPRPAPRSPSTTRAALRPARRRRPRLARRTARRRCSAPSCPAPPASAGCARRTCRRPPGRAAAHAPTGSRCTRCWSVGAPGAGSGGPGRAHGSAAGRRRTVTRPGAHGRPALGPVTAYSPTASSAASSSARSGKANASASAWRADHSPGPPGQRPAEGGRGAVDVVDVRPRPPGDRPAVHGRAPRARPPRRRARAGPAARRPGRPPAAPPTASGGPGGRSPRRDQLAGQRQVEQVGDGARRSAGGHDRRVDQWL